MTITVATERVGSRIYITGNTFAIKAQLKSAGCHWDGDRKQWWIGVAKLAAIESLIGGLNGKDVTPNKQDLSDRPCSGKVEYKGRTYFVIGRSEKTSKLWLTVLDCSIDFWAAEDQCRWVKTYSPREFRGRTEQQTVGKLRRFIEESKQAIAGGYSGAAEMRAENSGRCRGCGGQLVDADHHRAMNGFCGSCAFDEFDC